MKETTLLFLRQDDEVLLAMKKRGFGEGRWNGVGGKINPGESVEDTLIREAQEEIGVTPVEYDQVADISFDQYFKGEHALMHVNVFIYCDRVERRADRIGRNEAAVVFRQFAAVRRHVARRSVLAAARA